jgi:hypothetical protein
MYMDDPDLKAMADRATTSTLVLFTFNRQTGPKD